MSAKLLRAQHLEALAHGWRSRALRTQVGPMRIAFRLPWPPSVNHSHVERPVRSKQTGKWIVLKHPSAETTAYHKRVSLEVLRQRVPRFTLTGKLAITVMACVPDWRVRDITNLWKQIEDSLQQAAVIQNDYYIDDARIYRGPIVTDGLLHVELLELPGKATDTQPLPLIASRRADLDEALQLMGAS